MEYTFLHPRIFLSRFWPSGWDVAGGRLYISMCRGFQQGKHLHWGVCFSSFVASDYFISCNKYILYMCIAACMCICLVHVWMWAQSGPKCKTLNNECSTYAQTLTTRVTVRFFWKHCSSSRRTASPSYCNCVGPCRAWQVVAMFQISIPGLFTWLPGLWLVQAWAQS